MRFTGGVEVIAESMVEAPFEGKGGSVGVLQAKLADAEEACESLENDDVLGM